MDAQIAKHGSGMFCQSLRQPQRFCREESVDADARSQAMAAVLVIAAPAVWRTTAESIGALGGT